MAALFRFSQLLTRSLGSFQGVYRRNIGMTTVLLAKAESSADPIQKLFVQKLQEYKKKAAAAGGGLVDTTPETKAKIDVEKQQIRKRYGEGDLEEFPKFDFDIK